MTKDHPGRPPGTVPMTNRDLPVDFTAFHQMRHTAYLNWAWAQLANRADAEEAVDLAFEQLAASWPRVLASENPAGYAWRVLKNRTIDVARARGRRPDLLDATAFETAALRAAPDDPITQLEESLALYQAIQALPERQQDVIVMLHCLGYTVAETADHLGITPAGVRSTARYARRSLQEAFGLNRKGQADDVTH